MSYAFDTLARAWETLRRQLPQDVRDAELATRFGFMLEELHEANHRLKDAVNKDDRVTADARRLEKAMAKLSESGCPLGCTATSNCKALRDGQGSECPARPFQLQHGDAA